MPMLDRRCASPGLHENRLQAGIILYKTMYGYVGGLTIGTRTITLIAFGRNESDSPAFDARTHARTRSLRFPFPAEKVFFASGVLLLLFELFAVPIITPRLGIRFCQRLSSVIEAPFYMAITLLSQMGTTGHSVQITAVVLLFMIIACSDQVGAFSTCTRYSHG